jgi:hypothetical protein
MQGTSVPDAQGFAFANRGIVLSNLRGVLLKFCLENQPLERPHRRCSRTVPSPQPNVRSNFRSLKGFAVRLRAHQDSALGKLPPVPEHRELAFQAEAFGMICDELAN